MTKQYRNYRHRFVGSNQPSFEKILENLHLDNQKISPLDKCMDACDL